MSEVASTPGNPLDAATQISEPDSEGFLSLHYQPITMFLIALSVGGVNEIELPGRGVPSSNNACGHPLEYITTCNSNDAEEELCETQGSANAGKWYTRSDAGTECSVEANSLTGSPPDPLGLSCEELSARVTVVHPHGPSAHQSDTLTDLFTGRHYGAEIILTRVRWYLRYALSFGVLAGMMTERGLSVDHSTIFPGVQHDAPELDKHCWPHLMQTYESWRVVDTYFKVRSQWMYVYQAVDSTSQTLNSLLN